MADTTQTMASALKDRYAQGAPVRQGSATVRRVRQRRRVPKGPVDPQRSRQQRLTMARRWVHLQPWL